MMSKQVLSIEQMQHLQELGLDISNASMCYYKEEGWEANYFITLACDIREKGGLIYYYDSFSNKEYILNEVIPAYTLQDVLELLPYIDGCQLSLEIDCDPKMIWYEDVRDLDESNYPYDKTICFTGDTILEAAYNALVWAIKAGCLKTDKRK